MNWYNEIDKHAARWLRNLIDAGHIPAGVVDERSIEDVRPDELMGFTQCHFFAGIGGWSLALQLAGWPADKRVWTGSCPCQPFSAAGKGSGFADERHLWPAFHWLISQCRPERVYGEQVASATAWIDLVRTDLEGEGYALGVAVLGAHSVGAPHQRQRLYWVADANSNGRSRLERSDEVWEAKAVGGPGEARRLADTQARGQREHGRTSREGGHAALSDPASALANANSAAGRRNSEGIHREEGSSAGGAWHAGEWLVCTDGKARLVEPGVFPLAHGVPGRVGLLRGYGNAIVPQVAAAFIEASA